MAQRIALIVGLAFWFPLLRGEFFAGHFAWPVQSPIAPLVFNAFTLMAALAMAAGKTPIERLLRLHPTWVATVGMIGAGLLLPFADASQVFATPFTVIAMAGIAAAFCALGAIWGVACIRLHPASQQHALVLDVALAYSLSYVTTIPCIAAMNPGGVRSLCLIISSCVAYTYTSMASATKPASLEDASCTHAASSHRAVSREVKLLIAAYVMILVLSGLLVGIFVPAGYVASSSPMRSLLSFGTALALVALTLPVKHRPPNATPLFGGAILVLVGTLLTMSGVEPLVATGSHILTAGRRFLWVLLWILLARTCITTGLCSIMAFGCVFPCVFALARVPVNILRIVDPAQYLSTGALYMVSTWLSVLIMGCVMVLVWLEALRWRNERKAVAAPARLDSESLRSQVSLKLAATHGLTERERTTLELLSRGYTVKRIADELCVSENTVRAHTKAIYRKVGCHSKQELVDLVELQMAEG